MSLDKILFTTDATVTGGRDGSAASEDGALKLKLSTPKALGGAGGEGTNPEQLFAAGYSACFLSALNLVASQQKQKLPEGTQVKGEVSIGPVGAGFGIEATLNVSLPGFDKETADALVNKAHEICPYSNATRGNIDVTLHVSV